MGPLRVGRPLRGVCTFLLPRRLTSALPLVGMEWFLAEAVLFALEFAVGFAFADASVFGYALESFFFG